MRSSSGRQGGSSADRSFDAEALVALWRDGLADVRLALDRLQASLRDSAEAEEPGAETTGPDAGGIARRQDAETTALAGIVSALDGAVDRCFEVFHASRTPSPPHRSLSLLRRRASSSVPCENEAALLLRFDGLLGALNDHKSALRSVHADYESALIACHARRRADTAPLTATGPGAVLLSTRQIDDIARRDAALLGRMAALDAICDALNQACAGLAVAHRKLAVDAERLLLLQRATGTVAIDHAEVPAIAALVAQGMPDANDVERRRQGANAAFSARFQPPAVAEPGAGPAAAITIGSDTKKSGEA